MTLLFVLFPHSDYVGWPPGSIVVVCIAGDVAQLVGEGDSHLAAVIILHHYLQSREYMCWQFSNRIFWDLQSWVLGHDLGHFWVICKWVRCRTLFSSVVQERKRCNLCWSFPTKSCSILVRATCVRKGAANSVSTDNLFFASALKCHLTIQMPPHNLHSATFWSQWCTSLEVPRHTGRIPTI